MSRTPSPTINTAIADLCRMTVELVNDGGPTRERGGLNEPEIASGRLLGFVLSGHLRLPQLGHLAQRGLLGGYAGHFRRVLRIARESEAARPRLHALLRQTAAILEFYPPLMTGPLAGVREALRWHLRKYRVPPAWVDRVNNRPDISASFEFDQYPSASGKYDVKFAAGWLGCPGTVKAHAKTSRMARGTGDDAGHLIGEQFGAPGHEKNLTRQNRLQNQSGGNYYELEKGWAEELAKGVGVHVTVRAYLPRGTDAHARPTYRSVQWILLDPDGTQSEQPSDLYFGNFPNPPEPPKSQE